MRLVVRVLGPLLLLATGVVVGCATNGAGNGAGGTAGVAGTGGTAGTAGSPIVFCEPTNDRCVNGTIGDHSPCCEQPVPDQANACDGTESTENPATCTVLDNAVTYKLTVMEVEGDCNVGYDLDACKGESCFRSGLTPPEGMSGVDNALAGFASIIAGVGGDLRAFNQALSDALCGATDDPSAGTCYGGDNDGKPCTNYAQCPGDGAACGNYDNDCMHEFEAASVRFVVDANPDEGCANVTVLADGGVSAHILNLSDDGCASGTLGTIPLTISEFPGSLLNTVVRMTVSPAGFSHGLLGGVMDEYTATIFRESLGVEAAVAWAVLDINASTPPVKDASATCNGLSATFVIGGIAE